MKNPTILKDELSLLRADKSAVVTELRRAGKDLKDTLIGVVKAEAKREVVRSSILEETARLDDIRNRAVFEKKELAVISQDLKNMQNTHDSSSVKNNQERKLHLGRIKELEKEEESVLIEISRLKSLYDSNSKVFNEHESGRLARLRDLDSKTQGVEVKLKEKEEALSKLAGEDKKMTKDRLRREDKLRLREKTLDAKETSVGKREEDLITMSKDMSIVYGRIKELYLKVDPNIDLDKLILQAL